MKRIVIVDDNESFLETLKEFIDSHRGFESAAFLKPEDALRYILENKDIYAVISDYEMPQMNGFDLAEQVIERSPTTRIIIMSGHGWKYLNKKAIKVGIENKVKLLCKSDIIDLVVLLNC